MDCVAKWLLGGGDRRRQLGVVTPGIAGRDRDILREAARPIHADDLDIAADMGIAGAAGVTVPADDMRLGRDIIANVDRRDLIADSDDIATELVAKDHRRVEAAARPG